MFMENSENNVELGRWFRLRYNTLGSASFS